MGRRGECDPSRGDRTCLVAFIVVLVSPSIASLRPRPVSLASVLSRPRGANGEKCSAAGTDRADLELTYARESAD
jgi:hypothetical protein